jgi:UTP:GlnB (protein PII) uridylyltransferase
LVTDVCRDAPTPQPCWISLLDRLLPAADARRIAAIVSDARLLRASADDPRGFEEREVLQLATHLGSMAHTRDAYQLALALGALTTRKRGMLEERRVFIDGVLDDAAGPAAARRLTAQRIATDDAAIERLRFAPVSYVLSHTSRELADQARLIDPLPVSGCVRVGVTREGDPDRWKIAVACRDANALLAHLTEVLTRRGFDIIDATIGTWPDGAVLDTFVVSSTDAPDAPELANDFEDSLRRRLRAPVGVGLIAEFNNDILPWHTVCDVTGPDQPGALLAISAAFARAKVMVYSARIATTDHTIQDRFTISDGRGRKLDDSSIERMQRALAGVDR